MKHFTELPHGYRWLTPDEADDFTTDSTRCGWMSYVEICTNIHHMQEYIRPWDCMVEFGMDHDHDPVECERIMSDMNPDYEQDYFNNADEFGELYYSED